MDKNRVIQISDKIKKALLDISESEGVQISIGPISFSQTSFTTKITGVEPANRKYPVLATRVHDGKQYKFGKDSILKYLGGNNIINRKSNLKNLLDEK